MNQPRDHAGPSNLSTFIHSNPSRSRRTWTDAFQISDHTTKFEHMFDIFDCGPSTRIDRQPPALMRLKPTRRVEVTRRSLLCISIWFVD